MARFRWQQQYQRRYPDEFLDRSDARYGYFSKSGSILIFFFCYLELIHLKERYLEMISLSYDRNGKIPIDPSFHLLL